MRSQDGQLRDQWVRGEEKETHFLTKYSHKPLTRSHFLSLISPVLEGTSKLVGANGKLEAKVDSIIRGIREYLYDRVLTENITPLQQYYRSGIKQSNSTITILFYYFKISGI